MSQIKVVLGKIASVFGLKGSFECFLYSNKAPSWKTARLEDFDINIKIDRYPHRSKKDRALCFIEGNPLSPEQLKDFIGKKFWIYRHELPKISEDEVYLCDLVGRPLLYLDKKIGEIVAIHDFGAGIVLEVVQNNNHKENSCELNNKQTLLDEQKGSDEQHKKYQEIKTKKDMASKKIKSTTIFIHWNEIKLNGEDVLLIKN